MTHPGRRPVDAYLEDLAASLPRSRAASDLLDEIRDHLCEAAEAGEVAGATREAAEREAVRDLGTVAELAPDFRTAALVCDARRQANRQLLGTLMLATCCVGVFHLLPAIDGLFTVTAPPHPVALVVAGTLLCPSLVLLGLSRATRLWWDARWLAWLIRTRTATTWLFQLGLTASATMMAHSVAQLSDSPHLWLVAGALGGHLIAASLVPTLSTRHVVGGSTRHR